jgi:hypothetical protein
MTVSTLWLTNHISHDFVMQTALKSLTESIMTSAARSRVQNGGGEVLSYICNFVLLTQSLT